MHWEKGSIERKERDIVMERERLGGGAFGSEIKLQNDGRIMDPGDEGRRQFGCLKHKCSPYHSQMGRYIIDIRRLGCNGRTTFLRRDQ